MQKNKNRSGLALGAIVALVSSLFVMTAPAQASEASVMAAPATGSVSQTTILAGEAFDVALRLGTQVDSTFRNFSTLNQATIGINVTKPEGVAVTAVLSGAGSGQTNVRSLTNPIDGTSVSAAAGTSATFVSMASGSPVVALSLGNATSVSASVTITVTPFMDLNRDGVYQGTEPTGTAMSITYIPWSTLGGSVTLQTPVVGEHNATLSFAVTANAAVNWTQLDDNFYFIVTKSGSATTQSNTTSPLGLSGNTSASSFVGQGAADDNSTGSARAYSMSYGVETNAFVAAETLSASVHYGTQVIGAVVTKTVGAAAVTAVTISAVAGDNALQTAATTMDARTNAAFSVNTYPYSTSATNSVAVASTLTAGATSVEFGALSGLIINGTTFTSSAALDLASITIPAGQKTVAVSSFGQSSTGTLVLTLNSLTKTSLVTITIKGTVQVPVVTVTQVAGLAGAAKTFAVTAKDQWGVSSVRTDQRIAASVVLGGSTSTTVSAALVNAATSITVTPTPATRTGSAVVTFTLQTLDQATQEWVSTATVDTVDWNVYSYVAGTDAFTSRTVSVSASVSYLANLSWSSTVAIGVLNSYSDVVVSAPGLMIQNADDTTATASDTLTIAANGQAANLKFTSRLVGTYTVTFTTGTATTTSQVIFDAAAGTAGATLTFDKTSIAAGETTTITGTLLDANGNPVLTSGTAAVSVAWTGKGLPFGNTTAMETNAAGQLTFYVLALSGDTGDAAISATYKPAGATVDTNNITVVQAVTVGAVAAAAADQKVNVGSFKGYVALYAKGYAGQKMSAIVAGKWITVASLASDFERVVRYTGAGYTITTKIYIDGVQVGDAFTTLTK